MLQKVLQSVANFHGQAGHPRCIDQPDVDQIAKMHAIFVTKRAQDGIQESGWIVDFFVDRVCTYTYISAMAQLNPIQILHQITQSQRMEPGKLCVMRQGLQGPYYNLQWREQGRSRSRYIPREQVQEVAEHTANYQTFQGLVAQYAQQIIERTRAERAAGLKTKTSLPKSSWPKTRRSSS